MKFTSTIIAALIAAALTGQATGIKLKADATKMRDSDGNQFDAKDYGKVYNKLMR